MKKILITLGVVMAAAVASASSAFLPISQEEMARFDADHAITIQASDLASYTSTGVTFAITNVLVGPLSLKFTGYELDQPFWSQSNTNTTFSIKVSNGPASATGGFINALETAYVATPTVYGSFGASGSITNTMYDQSGITNVTTITVTTIKPSDLAGGKCRFFFRTLGAGWLQK